MATRYWVVSLPVQNSPTSLWSLLQESVSKRAFDTPLYRFNIPNLRVVTLDSLLALSDELLKLSSNEYHGVKYRYSCIVLDFIPLRSLKQWWIEWNLQNSGLNPTENDLVKDHLLHLSGAGPAGGRPFDRGGGSSFGGGPSGGNNFA